MANSPSGDAVVDRLVRVLETFDSRHARLSVGAMARRAGLPRSSAYRLVGQLVEHGLLSQHDDGRISLGLRLWELTARASSAADLSRIAQPYLEDLNQVIRQHTQLGILHEDEVLVLERLSRPEAAINQAHVGERLPLHRTSLGMVLLAHAADSVREDLLERRAAEIAAHHRDIRRELAHIRQHGCATFDGFIDPETTGAAAPILDSRGRATAAVGIVVPRGSEVLPSALMALRTAARGISRALAASSLDPEALDARG